MEFLLRTALVLLTFHEIFYWVWYSQVKEYRLDRIKAGLSTISDLTKAITDSLDLRQWWRPRWTIRAGTSTAICFFVIGLSIWKWGELGALLVLIIAPLLCALSLVLSAPPFIFVKKILVWRAREKMARFKGTVIGITGSYGKTSVKEILRTVLSSRFKVTATEKNDNSQIGVAKTVLNKLRGDEDYFIVEMGAYKIGEIKAICDIVHPRIGIITGIGDQHLTLFQSLENIKKTKYELISTIGRHGLKLVADQNYLLGEAEHLRQFKDHLEFFFEKQKYSAPFLGKELARNALAVIKAALFLGLSPEEVSHALESLSPDSFFPKLIHVRDDLILIDNTYNSSRESFLSALGYLSVWKGYQKIVLTPGLIELGSRAKQDHEEIGKALKSVDKAYITNKNFFFELNASTNAVLETDYRRLDSKLQSQTKKAKTVILFQNRIPRRVIDGLLEPDAF